MKPSNKNVMFTAATSLSDRDVVSSVPCIGACVDGGPCAIRRASASDATARWANSTASSALLVPFLTSSRERRAYSWLIKEER